MSDVLKQSNDVFLL